MKYTKQKTTDLLYLRNLLVAIFLGSYTQIVRVVKNKIKSIFVKYIFYIIFNFLKSVKLDGRVDGCKISLRIAQQKSFKIYFRMSESLTIC